MQLKDCPKNEQLAEKRSFEGNCEILRTIFQPWQEPIVISSWPWALSSDIPATERGLFSNCNTSQYYVNQKILSFLISWKPF